MSSRRKSDLNRRNSSAILRIQISASNAEIAQKDHPWMDTYPRIADAIVSAAENELNKPAVSIKIGPPNEDVAESWGDTHFARQFARALRREGFRTAIDLLPDWDAPNRQSADVVVHVRGLIPYSPKPSAVNVLWIISHPEDVTKAECDRFDLVLVASEVFADQLRKQTETPVHVLLQATDATRFEAVEPSEEHRADLLFVGNSRQQFRPVVRWAVDADLPLQVYGSGWEDQIDESYIRGTYFPNEQLNHLYSSAAIVLNDHWPDMREHGFVANRIFDALAAGAFVISDDASGISDIFGSTVPTFGRRDEFLDLISHYLAHPEEQRELAEAGRRVVLSEHTFANRARDFAELIDPLLSKRPLQLKPPVVTVG